MTTDPTPRPCWCPVAHGHQIHRKPCRLAGQVTDTNRCGAENDDYPGEYHCTQPAGHAPVPDEDDDGLFWDHAAPEAGVWWTTTLAADPTPDTVHTALTQYAAVLRSVHDSFRNLELADPVDRARHADLMAAADRALTAVDELLTDR